MTDQVREALARVKPCGKEQELSLSRYERCAMAMAMLRRGVIPAPKKAERPKWRRM